LLKDIDTRIYKFGEICALYKLYNLINDEIKSLSGGNKDFKYKYLKYKKKVS